jgi:hypothetical protein
MVVEIFFRDIGTRFRLATVDIHYVNICWGQEEYALGLLL